MASYRCNWRLKHDGKRCRAGETIELSQAAAAPLLAAGAITRVAATGDEGKDNGKAGDNGAETGTGADKSAGGKATGGKKAGGKQPDAKQPAGDGA